MPIVAVLLIILTAGCSMARGVNESLPGGQYSQPITIDPSHVRLFKDGVRPNSPCARVAKIAAHGNGYATRETLERTLREEASKLGADIVFVGKGEVTKDETVATYGGGIALANQIQRPHLYGIACRSSKVAGLGVLMDSATNGLITYVYPRSLASKLGIVEGDKLLAINGHPLQGDPFVIDREISSKAPGDRVTVELLKKDSVKVAHEVVLEEVRIQ